MGVRIAVRPAVLAHRRVGRNPMTPTTRSGLHDLAGAGALCSRDDGAQSGSPDDVSAFLYRGRTTMKHAAIGALLLLFVFAGTASASSVVTGCQSITLTNSPLSATVYLHGTTTVVLGPVAGNAGPYTIPAGTYDVVWSDGYTKTSVVVGPCESITQPTPTPTPEVQLCDGPCATAPADARYPCTSNIAVIGPPCPDPTPSASPSSSPTPQATPSVPPSATPRTPDVTPRITTPPTSTTSTDAGSGSSGAVVAFFLLLGVAGIAIAAAPRRTGR